MGFEYVHTSLGTYEHGAAGFSLGLSDRSSNDCSCKGSEGGEELHVEEVLEWYVE